MELLKNIGISFRGDYISQGSKIDKCKKAKKLNIKNIEFVIMSNGKDMNFENIDNYYQGNVIVHVPTININQTNLKLIKDIIPTLKNNNINLITLDASSLLYDTFEWSTIEEQQNYIKNISKGIASLASSGMTLGIENTNIEKNNYLYGKSISNITDLLIHTRKILVEEYEITKENANDLIGVSLNFNNLLNTNEINNLHDWISIFSGDIKCIKVRNYEKNINKFNELLDLVIEKQIDVPLLLEYTGELEEINNEYEKYKFIINNKDKGLALNFDNYKVTFNSKDKQNNVTFRVSQAGFTNFTILVIIILTIVCAVLMLMVYFRQ